MVFKNTLKRNPTWEIYFQSDYVPTGTYSGEQVDLVVQESSIKQKESLL